MIYRRLLKRVIDVAAAVLGIIILSPLFLIIALVIKIETKGSAFFIQERVGKDKKLFQLYKFRTMLTEAPRDAPTHLLKNPDFFITKTGRFLRKTSLDELPQIFNILKGEMSMIGPRPALWNQYDLIEERDKYLANSIPPGLTGWAQINGRDELPIKKKAALDGEYLSKMGFFFDLKCFLRTVISVIKNEGVVEGDTDSLKEKR